MAGVRLGDGTTWVKSRGYSWVLGSYMAGKLYPGGQGSPVYYQTRRPVEPQVGSTICLDKTYLLDTVLRLEQDGLRGLQYALDNLHYAQVGGWVGGWVVGDRRGTACTSCRACVARARRRRSAAQHACRAPPAVLLELLAGPHVPHPPSPPVSSPFLLSLTLPPIPSPSCRAVPRRRL